KPTAPYYIGRGKAESIKESCQDQQVTSVIFDDELSPAQGRNLENLFARKVLERTQLILDIFAQRARSREGRLQIELARLQYVLPNKQRVLRTDTVGFLRKLPHTVIESFKATLEEVSEADLLIHIVDLSHPRVDEQMEAVDRVVKELDAYGKQTLIVFNKIDNLANREVVDSYLRRFPGSVAISARTGEGVNKLVQALESVLSSWRLRS